MSINPDKRKEVHDAFLAVGKSVRAWALEHNFSPATVYAVLQGANQGLRGEGHRVAIALGLKEPATSGQIAQLGCAAEPK